MSDAPLSARALNRATLARQLLLEPAALEVEEAVARVGGLQAQVVTPPFLALRARLRGFTREALLAPLRDGRLVRATLMRFTLHIVGREDFPWLRAAVAPGLERWFRGTFGSRVAGLDLAPVVAAGARAMAGRPHTLGELKAAIAGLAPDRDPNALAYAVRAGLPLVQVPDPEATWGFPNAPGYVIGPRAERDDASLRALVRRHLAAFGPASVADVQAWAQVTRLKPILAGMRGELATFRGPDGAELFDLPDAPRPGEDAPAPPRLLPDYDAVHLGHARRDRVLREGDRRKVFGNAGQLWPTALVDGRAAGRWRLERAGRRATVAIDLWGRQPAAVKAALRAEAAAVLDLMAPEATAREITC